MAAPSKNAIYGPIVTVALAQALTRPASPASIAIEAPAPCPWTSTTPITTVLTREPYTWAIATQGVTITFHSNSLSSNLEATMTFAPVSMCRSRFAPAGPDPVRCTDREDVPWPIRFHISKTQLNS
jgi:hypothetical protein